MANIQEQMKNHFWYGEQMVTLLREHDNGIMKNYGSRFVTVQKTVATPLTDRQADIVKFSDLRPITENEWIAYLLEN